MLNGFLPSQPRRATSPDDRRKERRYEVELRGELRLDGEAFPVRIADLSASGALVFLETPPDAGSEAGLFIEDFGEVEVEVMHAGDGFCGLALSNPAAHRDRLQEWLRQEVVPEGPAAAKR